MSVKNTGFLLDRLGQDCHPLQFLRELTQNSIEAIGRSGKPGQIIWDVDWITYELEGTKKLCIIDTGDGMTGPEMIDHINKLSSSGSEQSLTGNYGVGAKIAAATRNPEGLVYTSWKAGQGAMIHLWRQPVVGTYGIKGQRLAGGDFADYLELDDAVKPEPITGHGTKVVLLGTSAEQDSIIPPSGAGGPSRWMAKYLNSRFYRFPTGVTVRCREGWDFPRSDKDRNVLRTVGGQEKYLNDHALAKGSVRLVPDAIAHWWILKDEAAIGQNSGFIESSGHMAALYQNELYEMVTSRSGTAKLQQFGVIFGCRQVVIYVEPIEGPEAKLTTNTSRTNLLIANEPLPWADWAECFREKMPREIQDFIDEKAAGAANQDHSKSVRERLKPLLDLFKLSRYRQTKSGNLLIDDEQTARGGRPRLNGVQRSDSTASQTQTSKRGGVLGNIYSLFEKQNGKPGERVRPDPFPEVKWVSLSDGTRDANLLEDRSARFMEDQNILLINADFRVFSDMVAHFHEEYGRSEAVKKTIEDVVRAWFEQALVETVIGVQALKGSKEWDSQQTQHALSEEALSATVMQRYHINNAVKRELGARLGKVSQ